MSVATTDTVSCVYPRYSLQDLRLTEECVGPIVGVYCVIMFQFACLCEVFVTCVVAVYCMPRQMMCRADHSGVLLLGLKRS